MLGAALTYAVNQESRLMNVFLDGRLELSNNRAERAVRPFAVGRKNWLFSNTPKGADADAAIYSIVETAKANGLRPSYTSDTFWNACLTAPPQKLVCPGCPLSKACVNDRLPVPFFSSSLYAPV